MAEILTPAGGPRFFSVAVAGIMTPAIHHPLWYQLIGCITKAEADAAIPFTQLVQQFATFQTLADGGIRMTCNAERWEVAAFKEEDRPRLVEIASKVFEKLMETPINGYAFSSIADLDTQANSVRKILSDIAVSTGFGFEARGERHCAIHYANEHPECVIQTIIKDSDDASKIWVSYSEYYPLKPAPGYYVLGPSLKSNYFPHWEAAKEMGHRAVARVNAAAEVPDAD